MMSKALRLSFALAAAVALPSCLDDVGGGSSAPFPAPSNLAGTPSSDGTTIDLTWVDNSTGETGFRVDVAPVPINSDSDVTNYAIVGPNVTTYAFPTSPNTTTYFRVLAVTATQQSKPSNVISVTTPDVPIAPTGVSANVTPTSDRDVLLTWTDTGNETGYSVERSANGGSWGPLASLGANVTTYTDTATLYDSEYCYRITAINANGTSAPSLVACAQTRTTTVAIATVTSSFGSDISWFTSIAVAPDGTAHVSHLDQTYGDTWYTQVFSGGGYTSQAINPGFPETLGWTGTSIVRDSAGLIQIVANDVYNGETYHLTPTGSIPAWNPTPLSSSSSSDRAIIKLGPADSPHVIYQQGSQLHHAFISSGSWVSEFVASGAPDHFGFATDGSGRLHVSFRRPTATGYELVCATKPAGGSWSTAVVPSAGVPEFNSLAVDAAGAAHIAYNELTSYGLHHATNASGSWTTEAIHQTPAGSWGRFNAMAIDPATGRIHVSYSDALLENLRYARKDPGGSWQLKLLDAAGTVGRWTSIALGPAGVYISYGDATSKELRLVRGTP